MGSEELCELLFPYYQYVIEAFGTERCMFESNFPVDKESISYRTLWNLLKRIAAKLGLSESEKDVDVQRHGGARLSAAAGGLAG